ncbi:hypothetical protein Bca52824_045712 [Brassica carinata]|uniref:Uncharacterized protein n=1 Tax=Brassica carinata TaxID=52824 RepID=A0A8X7RE44_BRACI|nr:hypothetical protein Bca52824_045712 [Brassica carinata]
MYCNHSCESAKKDNGSEGRQNFNSGVWEKATHKEVYGSDICLEAEGRLKTEVRRLTNLFSGGCFVNDLDMDVLAKEVYGSDKCLGFSLLMDFQHRLNIAVLLAYSD